MFTAPSSFSTRIVVRTLIKIETLLQVLTLYEHKKKHALQSKTNRATLLRSESKN